MFEESIEKYTRIVSPIYTAVKFHRSDEILTGTSTITAINDEGWYITCRHVIENILSEKRVNENYLDFLNELKGRKKHQVLVENKYNIKNNSVVLVKNMLPILSTKPIKLEYVVHDYLDLAAIRIDSKVNDIVEYPVFSTSDCNPGKSLCKVGFPFAASDFFELNETKSEISVKSNLVDSTSIFPLDGIMTRRVKDARGEPTMFEMSTPGIKGQSGGPIFDSRGVLYGMQIMTRTFDLDFNLKGIVSKGTEQQYINAYSFIHLGVGINSSVIRNFLNKYNIKYNVSISET